MKKFLRFCFKLFLWLFIILNIAAAFYAYKFTHFYDAVNVVVIHQDKKSTWQKLSDALSGRNALKQTNAIIPNSTFKNIFLTTKDGLKLSGWYIKTDSISKGTVLLFHGHGGNKSGVLAEANEFLRMGFNTFLLDFRAHGNSDGNICTLGYYEAEDVTLAYNYIKSNGEKNIILWGFSMGAAAITSAIQNDSIQPAKIILESPFGSLLQAAEGRIRIVGIKPEPLAIFITFWGGAEQGFWPFSMKPSAYAKKINCPVLLQWGKSDPRVLRTEIDAVYNNIASAKKLVVYDSCGHQSFCSGENEKWKREVKTFLLQ